MSLLLLATGWNPLFAQQSAETQSYPVLDSLQIPVDLKTANIKPSSLGLAEGYLGELATKRGRQRKLLGGLSLGFGTGMAVIGGLLLSDADGEDTFSDAINSYYGQYYLTSGILVIVAGTIRLAIPSQQEKRYQGVLNYEDQLLRERQAEKELYELAKKARKGRVISSIFSAAGLTYLLFSRDNNSDSDFFIPIMAGSLIYSIGLKSLEERSLQQYLEEKAAYDRPKFSMELGAGPTTGGGGVVQLRLHF